MGLTAKLEIDGKVYELPVVEGTEKERAIDIGKLRSQSGLITIDPGFKNSGSCMSAITFLDGEKGILRYRGYPIEQLAEHSSFLEVTYLLLYGELPTKTQFETFENEIKNHTLVHEDMKRFFEAYPQQAHPMGILASMICSMSTFYPASQNPNRPEIQFQRTMKRMIAKLPTLAAMVYKNSMRHPMMYPRNDFNYVENFMYMTWGMPTHEYVPDPVVADALNKLLILHADHEQNCSTATVRVVGSSQANLYAAISAGVSALWGPLHGGANQAVIEMLDSIKKDGGDTSKWIAKAKDKDDPFRLMGFGHRVYKNFDPRAKIIKKACDEVLKKMGNDDDGTLEIAKKLEEVALSDQYFIERGLYPNVDFYSGIIYRAIGIPTDMFTVMFALGRLPGWIAQWNEMRNGKEPISRPRQIYTGNVERNFVPMNKRK